MFNKYQRIAAVILTTLFLFILLLSACAVVIETTHNCGGKDCDICRLLDAIIHVIRSTIIALAVFSVITAASIIRISRSFAVPLKFRSTPVTEKVRLLN